MVILPKQDGSGNYEITFIEGKEMRKRLVNADVAKLLQNAVWFGKRMAKQELQMWLNDGKELPH